MTACELPIGTIFDTPYESGCVVTSLPDVVGNFNALDSDGVECSFSSVMIARIVKLPTACERIRAARASFVG